LQARVESALKALLPRVQEALKRLPSLKSEMLGMMQEAREAAKAGNDAAATEAQRRLTVLLDKIEAQKGEAGQGAGGVSVMKLGKARIEWRDVRGMALADVGTLKTRIRSAFRTMPEQREAVEAGLKKLDDALAELNDELGVELDKILTESDAAKRAAMAKDVAATTRKFLKMTETHPVISAIDGTVYMPGIQVVKPLTKTLNDILDALAQKTPETAS
jgi:ribosomal protein S20